MVNEKKFEPTKWDPKMLNFKPFRFWCQQVMPAVYDDSLGYYELLAKLVAQLNNVMSQTEGAFNDSMEHIQTFTKELTDEQNAFEESLDNDQEAFKTEMRNRQTTFETGVNNTTNNFIAQFNQLKSWVDNYFDNLDVQEEINNKLDQLVMNGTLTNMVNNLFNQLQNQVAQLSTGSPLIVDSVSKMTDNTRNYVLESTGNIYTWVGGSIHDTGLQYAADILPYFGQRGAAPGGAIKNLPANGTYTASQYSTNITDKPREKGFIQNFQNALLDNDNNLLHVNVFQLFEYVKNNEIWGRSSTGSQINDVWTKIAPGLVNMGSTTEYDFDYTDMDDLPIGIFYKRTSARLENLPEEINVQTLLIIVFNAKSDISENYVTCQFCITHETNDMYYRTCVNGNFKEWKKVAKDSENYLFTERRTAPDGSLKDLPGNGVYTAFSYSDITDKPREKGFIQNFQNAVLDNDNNLLHGNVFQLFEYVKNNEIWGRSSTGSQINDVWTKIAPGLVNMGSTTEYDFDYTDMDDLPIGIFYKSNLKTLENLPPGTENELILIIVYKASSDKSPYEMTYQYCIKFGTNEIYSRVGLNNVFLKWDNVYNQISVKSGKNIIDKSNHNFLFGKYYNKNNELIESENYVQSYFVPVKPNTCYTSSQIKTFVNEYDENKNFINSIESDEWLKNRKNYIKTGENTKYCKFIDLISNFETWWVSEYDNIICSESDNTMLLTDKIYAAYGDSITARNTYQPYLNAMFKFKEIYNFGIGSSCIAKPSNDWNGIKPMCDDDRLNELIASNPDIVTIFGGINDFVYWEGGLHGGHITMGEEEQIYKWRVNKDKTTFYGAYSYIIEQLLNYKSDLIIILCAPYYTKQQDLDYDLDTGIKLKDINKAVKDIASYFGLPVIDMNTAGLNSANLSNGVYGTDGVHPNRWGAQKLAERMYSEFEKINKFNLHL